MLYSVKSWCVHPSHDEIDAVSGRTKFTKTGQKPTHPTGIHKINAFVANVINQQYLSNGSTLKEVFEGDKICTNCLRKISKNQFINGISVADADEDMSIDGSDWISSHDNNDYVQFNNDHEDLPSSQEKNI